MCGLIASSVNFSGYSFWWQDNSFFPATSGKLFLPWCMVIEQIMSRFSLHLLFGEMFEFFELEINEQVHAREDPSVTIGDRLVQFSEFLEM